MAEVTQANIQTVMDALKIYVDNVEKTNHCNLQEFIDFVEPKFFEAGYRTKPKLGEKINVMIMHDAGVGDFVLQTGAIREIRRIYPSAHITLVVGAPAASLAEFCPHVDEIVLNNQHYDPLNYVNGLKWNLGFVPKLLARRYHVAYAFVHNPITTALMYMSGAQERVSHFFESGEETFVCHCNMPLRYGMGLAQYLLPMYNYGDHVVDTCFSLIEAGLHAPIENRELEIWFTGLDVNTSNEMIKTARRPLYAVVFGGNRMVKHYPPEKYAKVLEMIVNAEPSTSFVVLGGGQADSISAKTLHQSLGEDFFSKHVIDLTNKTTYRQTAAVLGLCDMYIGNDTGSLHVAAAMKCPCLAVFPFPADFPAPSKVDGLRLFRPYKVPSVVVQPAHALDQCARPKNEPYIPFGCRVLEKPHCIAQIPPEVVFAGFQILKDKIAKHIVNTTYVY